MWQGEILAALAALSGGAIVATALAAFIIELGIIPRLAGITHTAKHILLYENCLMLGSFLGNLVFIYRSVLLLWGRFSWRLWGFVLESFWVAGLLHWAR